MNVLIQIGLGLIPAAFAMWSLIWKRKAWRLKNIFAGLLLVVGVGACLWYGAGETVDNYKMESSMSKKETMKFANALFMEGLYDEADEVLESYTLKYGYDDECRLISARLEVAAGDYQRANGIYQFLLAHSDIIEERADEVQLTEAKATYSGTALAQLQYMVESGADIESHGYTDDSYSDMEEAVVIEKEEILEEVCDAIEDTYEIDKSVYEDCAESMAALVDAEEKFATDNGRYSSIEEYYEDIQDDFEDVEDENSALANTECFQNAKLKLHVQLEDYEAIVEQVDSNTEFGTLMVAAELYMNGTVKEKDFSSDYQGVDSSIAKLIERKLEDIYEDMEDDLTVQESKNLEERVEAVVAQLEDPTLLKLKEQLLEQTDDKSGNKAGSEQTKVYLQVAKIDHYFQNEASSDYNINQAMNSSQDSKDGTYSAAMAELIGVVNNEDADELDNIKNVSSYVDAVLDHSLTVDVESIINAGNVQQESAEDEDKAFDQAMEEYVARAKSAISIGQIDTSDFENITATVQITSDYITDVNELKEALVLQDCGIDIEDFDIEKLEYDEMNLLLCCDVSGSMFGAMEDLKESVKTFITDKNKGENISVVTFDDEIVDRIAFGSNDEALLSFAENMDGGGGTSIYDSVYACLSDFDAKTDDNNIIILMTDGQDGSVREIQTIYEELGALALEKGVTIYTLGLGDSVDVAYLTDIANSGNGDFIYVADSYSLTSFYDMLHEQVANQYHITYQAVDTMTKTGRTLKIELPSEGTSDNKVYSINGASWGGVGDQVDSTHNLGVYGLNVKYIYKGSQDITVKLKGTGFSKECSTTFKLDGSMDYTMPMTYVDEETYELVIPASVAAGIYNADIFINGQRAVLKDEFTVVAQGEEEIVAFGPYQFKAVQKLENSDGSITLSGRVMMNDWLNFKGKVTLAGDLDNADITMIDNGGSYVMYDAATAKGLGKKYAEMGLNQAIPALGNVRLYNDLSNDATSDDYRVDRIYTDILKVINVVQFDSPTLQLYPYKFTWEFNGGTAILPYQDSILKAMGTESPFDFDLNGEAKAVVTGENVGIEFKLDYEEEDDNYRHQINLGGAPVNFNGGIKIDINTIDNDYLFGAMIRMAFVGEGSGFSAELGWKDAKFDSINVGVDLGASLQQKLTYYIGGVPVTLTDFSLGASNIEEAVDSGNFGKIRGIGTVGIAAGKVSAMMPAAEKFFGDISVFSLPETKVEFQLSPFTIEVSSALNFLSEIELAQAQISLGTFEYTNPLFNMFDTKVAGLSARIQQGLKWETDDGNFHLELTGSGQLDIHSRFVGPTYTGTGKVDLNLWVINVEILEQGRFSMGLYTCKNGKKQFVVGLQQTGSKNKTSIYYFDEDGNTGTTNGTLA